MEVCREAGALIMYQVRFLKFHSIWVGDIYSSHLGGLVKNKGMLGPGQTVLLENRLKPQGNVPSLLANAYNSAVQSKPPELDIKTHVCRLCPWDSHPPAEHLLALIIFPKDDVFVLKKTRCVRCLSIKWKYPSLCLIFNARSTYLTAFQNPC